MTPANERFDAAVEMLAKVKAKLKALQEEEAALKATIEELFADDEIIERFSDPESPAIRTPFGTVRLQERPVKAYGPSITEAEASLKQAKQLANDMGDYDVVASTNSVVFTAS